MNKRSAIALACLLSATAIWAGDGDFGMWGEISVTKRLPYNLSLGVEAEVRGCDNLQHFDRWNVGMNMGYKPLKWLKLNVGYTFLEAYKPEYGRIKYKKDGVRIKDYRVTESYFSPRHRAVAMVTFTSPKLWKWVRVSLRERYQFTWRGAQDVPQLRYDVNSVSPSDHHDVMHDGHHLQFIGEPDHDFDHKALRRRHSLRSRLKVEMDKKRIDWHPFIAYETYNDLSDGMHMTDWRLATGTSWDVGKHHSIGAAYIYNVERDPEGNGHQHVLSLSYEYKF